MKFVHSSILGVAILFLATAVIATPPPIPEPIGSVMQRFNRAFPAQCEDMISELRKRLGELSREELEQIRNLEGYLQNIRQDDLSGANRAIADGSTTGVLYWCHRLTGDITGFRRVCDRLVIESAARNRLVLDTVLLDKLSAFWERERFYDWRFGHELFINLQPY